MFKVTEPSDSEAGYCVRAHAGNLQFLMLCRAPAKPCTPAWHAVSCCIALAHLYHSSSVLMSACLCGVPAALDRCWLKDNYLGFEIDMAAHLTLSDSVVHPCLAALFLVNLVISMSTFCFFCSHTDSCDLCRHHWHACQTCCSICSCMPFVWQDGYAGQRL